MKRLFIFIFFCTLYNINATSVNNIVLANAKKMLGTPYVPSTLEINTPKEKLVVNLKQVDCTTFVEYVLAKSLCIKTNDSSEFVRKLLLIRYRDGILNGYTSRLHYISEWIENAEKYNFVKDITKEHSNDSIMVTLSYMTDHNWAYKQLINSVDDLKKITEIEHKLSGKIIYYIPKEKLPSKGLSWIHDGDIITIVTNIKGLDIAHLGIAIYRNKELHLLHASSLAKEVIIEKQSLSKQLLSHSTWLGIRVIRMIKQSI